jgi:hypothetical protein
MVLDGIDMFLSVYYASIITVYQWESAPIADATHAV